MKHLLTLLILANIVCPPLVAFEHAGFYVGKFGVHPDSWAVAVIDNEHEVHGIVFEAISGGADTIDLFDIGTGQKGIAVHPDGLVVASAVNYFSRDNAIGQLADNSLNVIIDGYPITASLFSHSDPEHPASGYYWSLWEGDGAGIRYANAVILPDGQIYLIVRSSVLFGDPGGQAVGKLNGNEFHLIGTNGYVFFGEIDGEVISLSISAHGHTYSRQMELLISSLSPTPTNPFYGIYLERRPVKLGTRSIDYQKFPWIAIEGIGWAYCASSTLDSLWLSFEREGWIWTSEDSWPWAFTTVGWVHVQQWPIIYSVDHGWVEISAWPWLWSYDLNDWVRAEG